MNLLDKARQTINETDEKMAELFEKRMRAVELVAEHKMKHGLPILDKEREAFVIKKNSELIKDKTLREYFVKFLESNMNISKSYQLRISEGMNVAYCGTEGAFAHIATAKIFPTAKKSAFGDFASAYDAVVSGKCDAAVLPVENSFNGEVGQVTDLMFSGSLYINDMLELAVTQDLVALPGASLSDIKEVISHPQALGQCSDYIRNHGFIQREYSNTALAAKYVKEKGDKSLAAIASEEAAEIFGLQVLERKINESSINTTRFAVFSRAENKHKTSEMGVHTILLFTVRNVPGSLARAIDIIGKHGFNMRSLRSRPMKDLLWQYYFYVEAEGNINTPEGAAMMLELEDFCDKLKAVGTYVKKLQ
ncbi:MAG: chorismate mutase [Clostridia bacterium]|nr:chorismate mutase [Clostridia bacterium]